MAKEARNVTTLMQKLNCRHADKREREKERESRVSDKPPYEMLEN